MDSQNESVMKKLSEKERRNEQLNQKEHETNYKMLSHILGFGLLGKKNLPNSNEERLLKVSEINGFNEEIHFRKFNQFVTIASNFASTKFIDQLQHVPEIVEKIKVLIAKMKKEVKEFAKIANDFEKLIHLYVKIVMMTKHNLNMIKPSLGDSIIHFSILEEAIKGYNISETDKNDCNIALNSLSKGFNELYELSKIARKECGDLDKKIEELKKQCIDKRYVFNTRNESNQENSERKPIGIYGGIATAFAFMSVGTPMVFGLGTAIASIMYLIKYLWDTHQENALKFLDEILLHLSELKKANDSFTEYMNNSQEISYANLNHIRNLEFFLNNGSVRYRVKCSELCSNASKSTNSMIEIIEKIDKIDMTSWSISSIKTDAKQKFSLDLTQ